MSEDLNVVVPEPIIVVVGTENIEIKQIKVGQMTKIMRIAYPFYDKLKAIKDEAKKNPQKDIGIDLFSLVVEHGDSIIDLMAVLTNKDREWAENLELDSLVSLFTAVVEVNLDFFIQRVLPLLSKLVGELNAPEKGTLGEVGLTPSNP